MKLIIFFGFSFHKINVEKYEKAFSEKEMSEILEKWKIALISVGAVLAATVIIIGIYFLCARFKKSRAEF